MLQALGQLLGDSGVEVWVSNSGRIALVPAESSPAAAPAERRRARRRRRRHHRARRRFGGTRPLANAQVVVVGTKLGAMTNDAGRYTIAGIPAGTHTVRATLIGYAPQIAYTSRSPTDSR